MLNKLFQYYSSETNNSIYKNNKNSSSNFDTNENKINSKDIQSDEGENTIEIMKDNIYEDDSNTFLTKLKNYNVPEKKRKEFNISKLIKRRYSLSDIKRNNEIIKNDKNVRLHCFLSKVQKDISLKKILYKYIDKTLYEFEDDPLYKRVKEFEDKIEKLLKNDY